MKFDDKTKRIVCLVVAIALMIPIALGIASLFILQ